MNIYIFIKVCLNSLYFKQRHHHTQTAFPNFKSCPINPSPSIPGRCRWFNCSINASRRILEAACKCSIYTTFAITCVWVKYIFIQYLLLCLKTIILFWLIKSKNFTSPYQAKLCNARWHKNQIKNRYKAFFNFR